MRTPSGTLWWQRGVIYQIYPRSFQDSNGDGVGDLRGIASRLDYLQWLGIDAIWISPIYPSPMADFGYDVSDYCAIHPLFGDLACFDELLHNAHARGLKVILDFVPNHTSDHHPWFLESRSSRENPKRDWYLWRDPARDGGPPNNWLSHFGGSGWTFDEKSRQYYYHAFLREQPDLNWRNEAVEQAMLDVLRFWLDRGVDGFRVDVIWQLIKDAKFRNNPPNLEWKEGGSPADALVPLYTADQPEVHALIAKMRRVVDAYSDRVLIGEIYLPLERLVRYYGENLSGAHLPFNFQLLRAKWDARHLAGLITEYEAALPVGGWPNWVLGNHDRSRIASRVGRAQACIAAMLLLTLRGTPTVYYGDEIGMIDVAIPAEYVQDPYEKNAPGHGRDPARTPMQWDASNNAGFTRGTPWLPLGDNFEHCNVARQMNDPGSMLTLHHRLIALRCAEPALSVGGFKGVSANDGVLAFVRTSASGNDFLIVLNFSSDPREFSQSAAGEIVVSTHGDRQGQGVGKSIDLRGDEGLAIRLV